MVHKTAHPPGPYYHKCIKKALLTLPFFFFPSKYLCDLETCNTLDKLNGPIFLFFSNAFKVFLNPPSTLVAATLSGCEDPEKSLWTQNFPLLYTEMETKR